MVRVRIMLSDGTERLQSWPADFAFPRDVDEAVSRGKMGIVAIEILGYEPE